MLRLATAVPHMRTVLILATFVASLCRATVTPLDDNNIDQLLKSNEIVFVNFYADWCRFSQMLKPIFAEASEKFKDVAPGKVLWANVDADKQQAIAGKYNVNKYPTLKLFRNGELVKKEYRSQRSVEALTAFVQKQLDSAIQKFTNEQEVQQQRDPKKRVVSGAFSQLSGVAYDNFRKVAGLLREECIFFEGPAAAGAPPVAVRFHAVDSQTPETYNNDLANFDLLKQWLTDRCIPLVREITFENAEELTEEGLPFLILFRLPGDSASEKIFADAVARELADQKASINALVGDGKKFAHPLHHLGKGEKDLPVIAIDSFRHMYLFPKMEELTVPGKLREFVLDLHNGKLHREFHNGPDHPAVIVQVDPNGAPETQPPPSVFEKLKPSHNRYSLVDKDEL